MMAVSFTPLLLLVLAHLLGDFVLQSKAWVHSKRCHGHRSLAVYQHAGLHGLLALVLLLPSNVLLFQALTAAAIVATTHLLIDIAKSHLPDRLRYFLLDQLLHLAVILLIWIGLFDTKPLLAALHSALLRPSTLAVLLTYVAITRPLSILIALVMQRWNAQVDNSGTLADAGARIGMLERFLVLTFVLAGEFTPIGFLLAAKSVLRFGDLREDRDRKLTEYVLLGTMLSFSLTLILGLALRHALNL